jgi:endonuclease YncB( thermonuclease family)
MRWLLALGLALSVLSASVSAQRPRDYVNKRSTAHVVGVIDGDTVDLRFAPKHVLRVRLHGIDTPEREQPFYTQARNFTRVLMFGKDVEVAGKEVDPYGRLVARILVDGRDASAAIVAAGLGCTFHRYASDPALDSALTRARDGRLGFWASGAQQPPCVARELRSTSRRR